MSGYQGFSKSNNAIKAESLFRFPASVLAKKLKVKTGAIKALMEPCEWHHTSKHYNPTDYYDGEVFLELHENPGDLDNWGFDAEEIAEASKLLEALRTWQPPRKNIKTWTDCTVKWLEWGGTRKHPTATEETADGCR